MRKNVFAVILVLILSLFAFAETTNAAIIPASIAGCTGAGADSGWISATQYQGWYSCYWNADLITAVNNCTGIPSGWKPISHSEGGLLNTHGCVGCPAPGCHVIGILWEQIPAPTCAILASPDSFLKGESHDITITWTTTFAAGATLNGTPIPAASLASGNKIFTAVFSTASYTMSVTGLDGSAISCAANVSVIAPVNVVLDLEPAIVETDIAAIITNIIKWLLKISGSIALLMLIFAGVMYITSSGDSEAAEKAKKFISVIISGLILILLSYAILIVISDIFT